MNLAWRWVDGLQYRGGLQTCPGDTPERSDGPFNGGEQQTQQVDRSADHEIWAQARWCTMYNGLLAAVLCDCSLFPGTLWLNKRTMNMIERRTRNFRIIDSVDYDKTYHLPSLNR